MKPISDQKKKAKGTLRKSRIKNIPVLVPSETIEPPAQLSVEARREWDNVAKTLQDKQVLTDIDKKLLMGYCIEMAKYFQFNKELEEKGTVLPLKDKTGKVINYMKNPLADAAARSLEQALKIGAHFGLTPYSRTKINIKDNRKSKNDPIAEAEDKFLLLKAKGAKVVKMKAS